MRAVGALERDVRLRPQSGQEGVGRLVIGLGAVHDAHVI